jgi:hypothetical protein
MNNKNYFPSKISFLKEKIFQSLFFVSFPSYLLFYENKLGSKGATSVSTPLPKLVKFQFASIVGTQQKWLYFVESSCIKDLSTLGPISVV